MKQKQPNILLIMPDQMRADCIGSSGNPSIVTPNIDTIGATGCRFNKAYATCPSCIPARRALLTGQYPARNRSVGFSVPQGEVPEYTLPSLLAKGGYHSVLVGRNMHQDIQTDENPGYETCILGSTYVDDDEYSVFLEEKKPDSGGIKGVGIDFNGWQSKSWPFEEYLHPTNWVTQKTRGVIKDRNASEKPLFLTASYYAPHPPLIPPEFYYGRYMGLELKETAVGDWAEKPESMEALHSPKVDLSEDILKMTKSAYYGMINHIDDQLTFMLNEFKSMSRRQGRPWVICFTSDHGEMLGDHYYFRKCEPFEGSSRIPFLIASSGFDQKEGIECDTPVCLEDLLPTFLDFAGLEIPESVDGKSLLNLLQGEEDCIRQWLHVEHSPIYSEDQAFQMVTDGHWKYIRRPMTGDDFLFDLNVDPDEKTNRIKGADVAEIVTECKAQLIKRLTGRPEGFVENGSFRVLKERYPPVLKESFISEVD